MKRGMGVCGLGGGCRILSYLKHNFVLRPLLSFVCHLVSVVIFSKVSDEFGVWDLGFSAVGEGGKGGQA